uniref:Uncharacterized protein n=1 Tax=Asparagus officinalis TaxID=4686 RepID=Q2AA79_ASPOF|nr:hypothetical protein 18.t00008 [Asparagus officinalis]
MSLRSDPPICRSLRSDPPICRSLRSDPPICRSLQSDPPICRSLRSDPPICRSFRSDPPICRSLQSDPPIYRSLQSDPSICRSLQSDPPIYRSLQSDPLICRSLRSDPPICRSLQSDPPIRRSPRSDPPIRRSLGSDPPLCGSPKSDPPTRGTLKSDPRQGKDRRRYAHVSSIPSSSAPPTEHRDNVDLSHFKVRMADHPGPLYKDQDKVAIKERLGLVTEPRAIIRAGGRTRKTSVIDRLGRRIKLQEPVESSRLQMRDSKRVTLENANKELHTQKKTRKKNKRVIPEDSCKQPIGCSDGNVNELYYRAGGMNKSRKRYTRETKSHCPCAKLIRAVLSACSCPKTAPQRVSVFERIFNGATKPKPKRFYEKQSAIQGDELPEVTINMADKGKSIRPSSSDPLISHRLTRLRSGTTRRRDYQRMQRGLSSDDEASDANSAVASDNTVSSPGQSREVFMINTEEATKMVEDALAKQKQAFKFEMEMAMLRMREEHDQQIRALSNQLGESGRRNNVSQAVSDSDVDEYINADEPLVDQNAESGPTKNNDAGGGPTNDDNTGGGPVVPITNRPNPDTSED